jgi:uncharacterized protein YbbC (DUF1343 family)/CubicO group peptidase (beta-lactamase class C family)
MAFRRARALGLVLLACASAPALRAQRAAPPAAPSIKAGLDLTRLAHIDDAVAAAIAAHQTPGAVVVVGRGDTVMFQKAYGDRALVPAREAMTLDTIFDMASVTKVVATTTSVMMLVEQGKVRLADAAAKYIPEFAKNGKDRVTIRDLMTHMSGLPPDLSLKNPWTGADTAIALACDEKLTEPPGRRFVYSDINFIVLAEIVKRVSGQPLDVYAAEHIFKPLGMTETMFTPPASLRPRIAPTEKCVADDPIPCDPSSGGVLRGVVHDPTSRRMGGVAGHAGLFSTAADLTIFCRMLLNGGVGPSIAAHTPGARILAPLTIGRMTSPATAVGESNVRGLGWDLDSAYSANRGEILPLGSFGHTGYTGTSLWLDPATKVFIIFLSNRVHPDGKGDVTPVRAEIASIVAASIVDVTPDQIRSMRWSQPPAAAAHVPASAGAPATAAPRSTPSTLTGIDVLAADHFTALKGLRVGLLTNHTGRTKDGRATIDVLSSAPGTTLVALFSPEHGIRGVLDDSVPSSKDDATGLPIYSLYGETERPTDAMLTGLDAIVIDLQDIGARFYTYMTTMAYVMEAAASHHLKVFVLDRPNPLGGVDVEGPALDESAVGFTGYLPSMPIRHGLTLGEIARLFNGEKHIGADLTVIPMKNWQRGEWYDETGLAWVNPSPNMRNLYEAALYPGIGAFESTNVSVGRGTDTPFEQIGAPWIDESTLSDALNARAIPGVRFYPVRFTPASSVFAGQDCHGVFVLVTDRAVMRPVRVGVEIASALVKLFGASFNVDRAARLFGSATLLARIKAGEDPAAIAASWASSDAAWLSLRLQYLEYK